MSIYAQLTKLQNELKSPKNQYNSFGKYKYRNAEDILEAVKPLLAKYELTQIINDEIVQVGDRYYVKSTVILFDAEGQEIKVSAFAREAEEKKGMDSAQVTGATSSYARKYALNGMYAIDDTKDADFSNDRPAKQQANKPNNPKPAPATKKLSKLDQVFEAVNNGAININDLMRFMKASFNKTKSTDLNEQEIDQLYNFVSEIVKASNGLNKKE